MEIKSFGYGKFEATNGIDVVNAEFERGKKGEDGKFHPHWNLTINGHPSVFWGGKEEVVEYISKLIVWPLDAPLAIEKAREIQGMDGNVHGIIAVSIDEFLSMGRDDFPVFAAKRLCGQPLDNVSCYVTAALNDGRGVALRVSGVLIGEQAND